MQPQVAPAQSLTELDRLTGVFFSPSAVFADILRRPRWLIPILILTIASTAFVYFYSQRVGFERLIQQTFEQSPRVQALAPDQRERAFTNALKLASVMGYVSAGVAPVVLTVIVSAVILFLANALLGLELRYSQMFGITAYASLIGVIRTGISALVMYLKPPEDFDLRNPIAFNLGAFLSPDTHPAWLVTLAGSFDFFTLWIIALLAIGLCVASRKVRFSKALFTVLIPWLIYVCFRTASASIFS